MFFGFLRLIESRLGLFEAVKVKLRLIGQKKARQGRICFGKYLTFLEPRVPF